MSEDVTLDEFVDENEVNDEQAEPATSQFWGEIPVGWELAEPDEVYNVNPNPKPEEEPNTYIEMDALDTDLPWPRYFGERNASEYSGKTFTTGDTLFARITPCTENGKTALVSKMETEVGIGSTEYAVLSPKRNRVFPWYLYYISNSHPVHNYAISRMRGSTGRQRVPFSVFRRELDIALPPLPEQRKIATVLYTVDQAIQKTEEIIEQTKRVRRGFIRERVIGANFEGERKEGTVGTRRVSVPEHWSTVRLGDVAKIVSGKSFPREYQEGHAGPRAVVKVEDMNLPGNDKRIEDVTNRVTEEVIEELNKNIFPADTVIHPRVGEALLLNKTRITTEEAAFDDNIMGWIPDGINPEYLYYASTLVDFNAVAQTGTVPSINKEMAANFRFPLPPEDEQEQIAEDLSRIDGQVSIYEEEKAQLQRLKQGLMQDLLSGTVRTTDTNIEVPDEIAQHG